MKKIAMSTIGIVVAGLCFKLFEPIFVYNFGWATLPRGGDSARVDLVGTDWSQAASVAAERLENSYNDGSIPGISVAIAYDGELIWRAAIGYADVSSSGLLEFDHQFRIGSSSKAVTAMAIGRLFDERKLDLDAKMGEFDSTIDGPLSNITLRQAMSHRGGVRNYALCFCFPVWEYWNRRHFETVRDSLKTVEFAALQFEPGTNYQYTSLGYNLAGIAAERSAGKAFDEVLLETVLTPLGMAHTGLDGYAQSRSKPVTFYEVKERRLKEVFRVDNSIRWPSGGVLSTPSDLVKLGSAMLDNRLLSEAAREELLTIPEAGQNNGGQFYALGWRVSGWKIDDQTTLASYHHNGTAVGSTSVFIVFPEQDLVVSAMMNKGAERASELAQIVDQIVGAFIQMPPSVGI